jgi:hypothetical protein
MDGLYNILIEFGISRKPVGLIKMCLNETCSMVHTGINMSDKYPIHNDLKQEDTLLIFPFNFALNNVIRRVQENQEGLKLNGIHQILAYSYDISILEENRYHTKNREALLDTSNEVGPEVNPEKIKYSKTWLIQNTRNQKKKFFEL